MHGIENISIDANNKYYVEKLLNKLKKDNAIEKDTLTIEEKSKYVEDLLLGFQSDTIIVTANKNNEFKVEKGNQILALNSFFQNEFELKDLFALPMLNGLKYEELPGRFFNYFNDYTLSIVIINPNTSEEIKNYILKR